MPLSQTLAPAKFIDLDWFGSPGKQDIYFAWVAPTEMPFNPSVHARKDESVFFFKRTLSEGKAPHMEVHILNPGVGLLSSGRKQWAWFSVLDGLIIRPLMIGRLVAIPAGFNPEDRIITLEFVAMPMDFIEQKRALAETMKIRPFYDEIFSDPVKRTNPDHVLEGWGKLWDIDPITLVVTATDLLVGEDGTVVYSSSDTFIDNYQFRLGKPPLKSVYVDMRVQWDQRAVGHFDVPSGGTASYTGDTLIKDWPKPYTDLGGGWSVFSASAKDGLGTTYIQNVTTNTSFKNSAKTHANGDVMSIQGSHTYPEPWVGGFHQFLWQQEIIITGNADLGIAGHTDAGAQDVWVPIWAVSTSLAIQWDANRSRTENARFSIVADVQKLFTDSGDVAADFAQDSELITLNGNAGLEVPFGNFRGPWQPNTFYAQYDIVTTGGFGYIVLRRHISLGGFDPRTTETALGGGVDLFEGLNTTGGRVTVLPTGQMYFIPITNPFSGPALYSFLPGFRGYWQTNTVYVAGDIVIVPGVGTFKVLLGLVSDPFSFDPLEINFKGDLFYAPLINPPAIGDLARRSYLPTDRGHWSIEYGLMVGRARLMERSRAIDISNKMTLWKGIGVTCRNSVQFFDSRIPNGNAVGKVVETVLEGDGDTGEFTAEIRIGVSIGLGGSQVASGGTPTIVDNGWFDAGAWQQYSGVQILPSTGDIGYTPPVDGAGIDDGLLFPLSLNSGVVAYGWFGSSGDVAGAAIVQALQSMGKTIADPLSPFIAEERIAMAYRQRVMNIAESLKQSFRYYELVLPPLDNGPFSAEYDPATTHLSLIQGINLG